MTSSALPPRLTADNIDDFLDEVEGDLLAGKLPLRVFNDEGLFQLETERIFLRAWIYVGHESEIPARGDYVQRKIGRDAFVLVRGEDGDIRLLFDSCRHRGAMVCRADKGNAAHFRCPYHGWTYKNTGEFAGAPLARAAYGDGLDKPNLGLHRAPRLESLHGFVFAALDEDVPSLEDYLGPMKWQMDQIWGHAKDGWEVVGEPQRFLIPANWKTAADNFSGDDYHTFFLHRSVIETGIMGGVQGGDISENLMEQINGYHVQAGNGHAISHFMIPPDVDGPRMWGYPPETHHLFGPEKLGQEQFNVAFLSVGAVGNVFPNFSFLTFPLAASPEEGAVTTMTVRVWQPLGPNEIEVWNWTLAPAGVSEEYREATYKATLATFSAGGTFEQDDVEPWVALGRTASTAFGKKINMKLDYSMALKGDGISQRTYDYPGPGVAYYPALEEGVHRGFHRRWAQFMRNTDFPPAMSPEAQNGAEDG